MAAHTDIAVRATDHKVLAYVARRVGAGAVTLVAVSILVFAACEVLPGDAASVILGRQAAGGQLRSLRREMGLNRPVVIRYSDWAGGLLHGNLGNLAAGYAAGGKITVWSQIRSKLANTALLAAIAFALAAPISVLLGTAAAVHASRTVDHAITVTTLVLVSMPEFVVGSLLILVFFSWLDLLPPVALFAPGVSPLTRPDALILPVVTLLCVTVGAAARMVRAGMIEVLRSEYVLTARMQGIPERRVIFRFALRNALAPSVQVLAQMLQYLLGGIVIVEYLFGYPGLGAELVNAVGVRDVFEVEAIVMLFAVAFIVINILADVIVVLLVPKLRGAP